MLLHLQNFWMNASAESKSRTNQSTKGAESEQWDRMQNGYAKVVT